MNLRHIFFEGNICDQFAVPKTYLVCLFVCLFVCVFICLFVCMFYRLGPCPILSISNIHRMSRSTTWHFINLHLSKQAIIKACYDSQDSKSMLCTLTFGFKSYINVNIVFQSLMFPNLLCCSYVTMLK